MTGIAGIGRILAWQGGSLWIGRDVGHARPHEHHAIQVSLALEGRVRLRGEGDWAAYEAAIVMPHRRHEFDGDRGTIAQLFVEPETARGRALMARYGAADITRLEAGTVEGIIALRKAFLGKAPDDRVLAATGQGIVDGLAGAMPDRASTDARIAGAVEFIARNLGADIALKDVAKAVHLSPGRLRHLFVQETGTTYRGYVIWLRLNRAVAAMMAGRTWTDAAHEAGFADSAHLSRMFRRMFGVSPTMIVREEG